MCQITTWARLQRRKVAKIGMRMQAGRYQTLGFIFSSRDIAAIADGFDEIHIGRSDYLNTMKLGDVIVADVVKRTGVQRDDTTRVASWRDDTFLYSDTMTIAGNVQAPKDILQINTRKLSIGSKNLHDPEGLPDSGLFAREVDINVKRQAVVSGWIKATDLVTLSVEDRSRRGIPQ